MNAAKNSIRRLFGRRLRPISSIVLVIVVAVIFLLNLGLSALENTFVFSADLSANQIFTLSEDSLSVLSGLTKDIYLYPVYSSGNRGVILLQLLKEYASQSPRIHLRELSSDTIARQFSLDRGAAGIVVSSQDGSIFRFIGDEELYRTDSSLTPVALKAEAKITSAILGIDRGAFLQICALSGHNELKISDLSSFSSLLEANNFSVLTCDLSSYTLNPSTDILLVAAPKTDLSESEYVALQEFLSLGGRALFLMENASFSSEYGVMQLYIDPLPRFESLLAQYGMQINKDLVVSADPAKINLRSTSMPVQTVPSQDLSPNAPSVVLSEMSSIRLLENSGIQAQELLRTHEACYLKELSSGLDNLRQDAEDAAGSFLVGAYAQKESSRLVLVTGNSLISNRGLAIPGNKNLLNQVLEYLSPVENDLSIPVKYLSGAAVSPSFLTKGILALLGFAVIPSLLIYLGVQICYKRKQPER